MNYTVWCEGEWCGEYDSERDAMRDARELAALRSAEVCVVRSDGEEIIVRHDEGCCG